MRSEILIFGITGFLLYNAYYDGKYTKMLLSYKKYYKMIFIAFLAICFYVLLKRNPLQTKNLLLYTNNMIKYMPIDKSSADLLYNPVLKQRNMLAKPNVKPIKRSVSETKKKYVASMQDWKCGQCNKKLSHTFEIDHKIRLEYGGDNDVTNLVALCRECHGEKTAMENM